MAMNYIDHKNKGILELLEKKKSQVHLNSNRVWIGSKKTKMVFFR